MNRFVVIAPFFNCAATARQMILSVAGQSYSNWHIVFLDDCSTDDSARQINTLCYQLGVIDKITYVFNKEKKWEVANVLQGLSFCQPGDIVCRLDPDDYLLDLSAFEIINQCYLQTQCDVLWTAHRWFDQRGMTNTNISDKLPDGADPYKHPWVSSHFKTFRKRLLDGVNDRNFRGADGEYIRRAGDQAIYLPALYRSKKRLYLPLPMYAYRCDMSPSTFQSQDASFQAGEAEFLRRRGFVQ